MKLPKIFKKTSTGATQEWEIEVVGNKYRTISGQTDGKKVVSEWTVVYGKNEGRANSTTDNEQALKEAESKRKLKLEKDYHETISEIETERYFKPMLAEKWEDRKDTIQYPIYSQPKLDGCVSSDTLVETDCGEVQISDIFNKKLDCKVKTYNERTKKTEYKQILNRMKNGVDINETSIQWYEITIDDGRTLRVTGNHLIYLPQLKCWRRVDELIGGEKILNSF